MYHTSGEFVVSQSNHPFFDHTVHFIKSSETPEAAVAFLDNEIFRVRI